MTRQALTPAYTHNTTTPPGPPLPPFSPSLSPEQPPIFSLPPSSPIPDRIPRYLLPSTDAAGEATPAFRQVWGENTPLAF